MDIETFFRDEGAGKILFMYSSKHPKDEDLFDYLDNLEAKYNITIDKKSSITSSWYYNNTYQFIFTMRYDGVVIIKRNLVTTDREFTSGFGKKLAIRRLRIRAERAARNQVK
jgi:hypothetical protein